MEETLTREVLAERIQNGLEEEELDTGSLDNTFQKNLLNKIAETGSIIWNGIRKKRVFSSFR